MLFNPVMRKYWEIRSSNESKSRFHFQTIADKILGTLTAKCQYFENCGTPNFMKVYTHPPHPESMLIYFSTISASWSTFWIQNLSEQHWCGGRGVQNSKYMCNIRKCAKNFVRDCLNYTFFFLMVILSLNLFVFLCNGCF